MLSTWVENQRTVFFRGEKFENEIKILKIIYRKEVHQQGQMGKESNPTWPSQQSCDYPIILY
jgi:hypothetical protein